jgi:lipoic acid synthetase
VLNKARAVGLVTKSNLILGMGETREEISQALRRPARRRAPT